MNSDFQKLPREEQEVRITALVLGELAGTEAEAVRAALRADPELADLHRRLETTVGLLREVAAHPSEPAGQPTDWPRIADHKRSRLLASLRQSEPRPAPDAPPSPSPDAAPRVIPVAFPNPHPDARGSGLRLALAAAFVGALGLLGIWVIQDLGPGSGPTFLASEPDQLRTKLRRVQVAFDADSPDRGSRSTAEAQPPARPVPVRGYASDVAGVAGASDASRTEPERFGRVVERLPEITLQRAKPDSSAGASQVPPPPSPATAAGEVLVNRSAPVADAKALNSLGVEAATPINRFHDAAPPEPLSDSFAAASAPAETLSRGDESPRTRGRVAIEAKDRVDFSAPAATGVAQPTRYFAIAPGAPTPVTGNDDGLARGAARRELASETEERATTRLGVAAGAFEAGIGGGAFGGGSGGGGAAGPQAALAARGGLPNRGMSAPSNVPQRVESRGQASANAAPTRESMVRQTTDPAPAAATPQLGDRPAVGLAFGTWYRQETPASPATEAPPVQRDSLARGESAQFDAGLPSTAEGRVLLGQAQRPLADSLAAAPADAQTLPKESDKDATPPAHARKSTDEFFSSDVNRLGFEVADREAAPAAGRPASPVRKGTIVAGAKMKAAPTPPIAGKPLNVEAKLAELEDLPELAKQDTAAQPLAEQLAKKIELLAVDEAPPVAVGDPVHQPEVRAAENAFSTFSLNVTDVSFKLAQASLDNGQLPPPAGVRVEEFLNALPYRDPEPAPGNPVGFTWDRARHPFAHDRELLRLAVRTAARGRESGRPLNLVLALDNSGSMERADRVQILREALNTLAAKLAPSDRISVVSFARTARLWLDALPGDRARELVEAVGNLAPEGGTNLEDALRVAYETAFKNFSPAAANRVVLLTDGAANLGDVDPATLKRHVEENRRRGVALDAFGVGWEGLNDDLLEQLTRNGDGRYGFVNTPEAAATDFANQLAGALQTAAADVKVQIEFNPARVQAWRQVGYAKHQLKKEQFRDNTVDAAELGAAESGNALYVLHLDPAGHGPLGTARVRFRVPETGLYQEREWVMPYDGPAPALETATPAMRLAAAAGTFGEWLARSPYAGDVSPDKLLAYVDELPALFQPDPRPAQLQNMLRQAQTIGR